MQTFNKRLSELLSDCIRCCTVGYMNELMNECTKDVPRTPTHTRTHVHTYTRTQHTHLHTHTHTYTRTHVHTYTTHTYTHTPTHTHLHSHAHTPTHTYTHLHSHAHTHASLISPGRPPRTHCRSPPTPSPPPARSSTTSPSRLQLLRPGTRLSRDPGLGPAAPAKRASWQMSE